MSVDSIERKIDIVGIKKKYGRKEILRGIDLTIPFSSCIGILGGNGSGKTTLLSILAGIISADEGSFICESFDLLSDAKRRRFLVGIIPQKNPLIEELSCYDNLKLWHGRKYLDMDMVKKLGVTNFLNKRVSELSEGMKKRLAIACAVSRHSKILLMDEPSAALDIVAKDVIYNYIREFVSDGGIVILVTHDEGELKLCDRQYILKDGILLEYNFDGDIKKLAKMMGD
ncbi:ATP-binding cassette domain-containing protein [Lachnoanaerobaculum umeaense]|uniref:ATP-binding cassette domain-containing protein n=1 Tax=Lachnoanaerobaculum umeaense TaxID=617123 RepID=A0A385Q4Y7_9FIRM|nr:ATP-binding cassette domain-containing protein [Lachnoanaerobaculum umeaense]AYA99983.1 ATP-binding cassette domain-containing protein [Lachnoanaerobaculum umeaense]PZW94048.1 ABC-2 type transport system ATP-binding protein [Lachnoanaerobaculum umeaense]